MSSFLQSEQKEKTNDTFMIYDDIGYFITNFAWIIYSLRCRMLNLEFPLQNVVPIHHVNSPQTSQKITVVTTKG